MWKRRRYGSLAVYQEIALTKAERKKRDRALKKMKNQVVTVEQSELEGRSLFVEKVIEMGAKLGVHFIGPMKDVIREIGKLEIKESDPKEKLSLSKFTVIGVE
ncbi:hypothetical protein V6N13_077026 [Hibiscus sabdariffa]